MVTRMQGVYWFAALLGSFVFPQVVLGAEPYLEVSEENLNMSVKALLSEGS